MGRILARDNLMGRVTKHVFTSCHSTQHSIICVEHGLLGDRQLDLRTREMIY